MFFQSRSKPKRVDTSGFTKYLRRATKSYITYRSGWEKDFMESLDSSPFVVEWDYENTTIPYFCPIKGKERKYRPDFYVKYQYNTEVVMAIVELKPLGHIRVRHINPNRMNEREKEYYDKMKDGAVTNMAKFVYADKWCKEHGMKFLVLTERGFFEIADESERFQPATSMKVDH